MTEMSECAQEKSMSASYSRMEDRGGQKKKKPNDTSTAEDTSVSLLLWKQHVATKDRCYR